MGAPGAHDAPRFRDRIGALLNAEPERPFCMHLLLYRVVRPMAPLDDPDLLERTRLAADEIVDAGRAHRAEFSALGIGVHCEDWVYWSVGSRKRVLAEFGPEYEEPTLLRRLASHIQCRGL